MGARVYVCANDWYTRMVYMDGVQVQCGYRCALRVTPLGQVLDVAACVCMYTYPIRAYW